MYLVADWLIVRARKFSVAAYRLVPVALFIVPVDTFLAFEEDERALIEYGHLVSG